MTPCSYKSVAFNLGWIWKDPTRFWGTFEGRFFLEHADSLRLTTKKDHHMFGLLSINSLETHRLAEAFSSLFSARPAQTGVQLWWIWAQKALRRARFPALQVPTLDATVVSGSPLGGSLAGCLGYRRFVKSLAVWGVLGHFCPIQ